MQAIIASNGQTYVVTPADRLWLLRAVQAEGPVQAQVAEALVNLFAYRMSRGELNPSSGKAPSLQSLIRAYAQPVNPRWYLDGDLHRAALSRAQTDGERAALRSAAERRERLHSTRTVFDAGVTAAVDAALRGAHRTDVTDYAAAWVDSSANYVARSPAVKGRNRLWTRAPGWAGYVASAAAAASGGVLVAFALAVFLWGVTRA